MMISSPPRIPWYNLPLLPVNSMQRRISDTLTSSNSRVPWTSSKTDNPKTVYIRLLSSRTPFGFYAGDTYFPSFLVFDTLNNRQSVERTAYMPRGTFGPGDSSLRLT